MTSCELQWYSFWNQWIEEVHTYTLVANIGVSSVPYRKSREGLQQPLFGGRVTKTASGGRGLRAGEMDSLLPLVCSCFRKKSIAMYSNVYCIVRCRYLSSQKCNFVHFSKHFQRLQLFVKKKKKNPDIWS